MLPLGVPIDELTWEAALDRISAWAAEGQSRYVCICNAHSLITARDDPDFMRIVRDCDMATPDGAPVAWMMRRLGAPAQQRINGPDLMLKYCELAQSRGEAIYLFGSTDDTLTALRAALRERWPQLRIAGWMSPPFRPLSAEEEDQIVDEINRSGAATVWVGLGCPKQEAWMSRQRGKIRAVMIGVGAAFDYHAGKVRRAPQWMQHAGLEWLHRLLSEPRRLWRRYVFTNTAFIVHAASQLARRGSR